MDKKEALRNLIKEYRKVEEEIKDEVAKFKGEEVKTISLKISDEKSVFNEYSSIKDAKINERILWYLEEQLKYTPIYSRIVIRANIPSKNEKGIGVLQELIKKNLRERIHSIQLDLNRNRKEFFLLLSLGLTAFIFLRIFNYFLPEITLDELFLVVCWVFLWTATEKQFFERKKILDKKRRLIQLYLAEYKRA